MEIRKYIQNKKKRGIFLTPDNSTRECILVDTNENEKTIAGFHGNKIRLQHQDNLDKLDEFYELELDTQDIRELMKWQIGQDEYNENQRKHEEKIRTNKDKVREEMIECGMLSMHFSDIEKKYPSIVENQKIVNFFIRVVTEKLVDIPEAYGLEHGIPEGSKGIPYQTNTIQFDEGFQTVTENEQRNIENILYRLTGKDVKDI